MPEMWFDESVEELPEAVAEARAAVVEQAEALVELEQAVTDAETAHAEAVAAADEAQATVDELAGRLEEEQAAVDGCPAKEELEAALGEATEALDGFEPEEGEEGEIVNQEDQDALQAAVDEAQAAVDECPDIEELNATVEATTEELGAAQGALEEAQAAAEETPVAIEEATAALEEAQGPLEEAYAALDEACDATMEELVAAVDAAVEAMNTVETPTSAALETETATLAVLAAQLAACQHNAERAEAYLAASEEVAAKQEELGGCEEELAAAKEPFDEATAALADGKIALDDAKEALAAFVAEPDEDGNVANAEEEEGLKAAVDEAAAALDDLKAAFDEAKAPYLEARAPVLALHAELANSLTVDEAQAQLDAATAAVDEAEAAHAEKQGEVEELQAQVDSEQEELQGATDEFDAAAAAAGSLQIFMKIGNEHGDSSDSDSSSDSDDDSSSSSSSSSSSDEEQEDDAPPKAKKPNNKLKLKAGAALSLCFSNQVVTVGMTSVELKDASAPTGVDSYLRVVHTAPGVMAFQNVHGYFLSASANSNKVTVAKSLTEAAMFAAVPQGNYIALRSSFGGYLQAVVEPDASSVSLWDGLWEVRWSDGSTANIDIKGGSWTLFGNTYELDLSDPANPTFSWPPTEEGGEPSGSQAAEIGEESVPKLLSPGFQVTWTTDTDNTIEWRRISGSKQALGMLPCTGLVVTRPPPGFEGQVQPSMLFNIVKRASMSSDPPIADMTKAVPKMPPAQLVFSKDSEQLNSGTEFIQEAWTNSTYVEKELTGYIKSINASGSADGSGALKLLLYRIEGHTQLRMFHENQMVDLAAPAGTQLRVLSAKLQGLELLDVTREAQSLVVGNSLFIPGGAASIVGDTEPGVDQTLIIQYAATRVLAIESIGKVTEDASDVESSFATINNNSVCTEARKGDHLVVLMASPPGQAFTCKEASVTVTYGSKKLFNNPNVEALPAFEVAAAPEKSEFIPANGYSVLSSLDIESNFAVVNHNSADLVASGEWPDFEEQAAENEGTWPSVVKIDEAGTIRVSNEPESPGHSFGIAIDPLLSRTMVVSCDVRTIGPLPINSQVGFRVTPITEGAALPFDGCINSWLSSVTSADRCHKTYKNRETVDIRSAGKGTTLAITSATLDGEDITDAVSELVEDHDGGQRLFLPGGVYDKLELDPPRTFGVRGEKPPAKILVLQWVSWSHVEFQISRPPGQSAVTLCLDGVPYKTQVDIANLTIYELESLDDVDMPPLPLKDIFTNEITGNPWDEQEYAAHLNAMSAQEQFVERCRVKAGLEAGLNEIATHDARSLREATKGLGTDDTVLKTMLVARASVDGPGSKHIQAIDAAYQHMFDVTLAEVIASETSGDYKRFLTALVTSKAKLDAMAFDKAMRGIGTDDDLLIELVCTRTNAELIAARKAYSKMYDKDLMTTVKDDTSGDLQKLLLMVLQATQDERVRTDEEIEASGDCEAIAQKIFNAIDGIGTDEGALIRIVCKTASQLWAEDKIPAAFEAVSDGSSLLEAIGGDTGGDFRQALLMKMKPSRFHVWAELLKKAGPDKLGTDEDTIIRILTCCQTPGMTLSESVEQLKTVYEEVAGEPLVEMLDSELSFNFGEAVELLVDELFTTDPFSLFDLVSARWDLVDGTNVGSDWDFKQSHLQVLSWIGILDACDIKQAMAGWGTDEDTLSNILSARTQEQVTLAKKAYADLYDEDTSTTLEDDIKSETSGDYSAFMLYLMRDPAECNAVAFRRAIKGFGTNDDLLLLLCCSLDAREIADAKRAYARMYGRVLLNDVRSDTSGDYRATLTQILRCQRTTKTTLTRAESRRYAEMLWAAGEGLALGTDEDTFIDVFTTLSPAQLRQVENDYNNLDGDEFPDGTEVDGDLGEVLEVLSQIFGSEIEESESRLVNAIKSEMSFNLKKALLLLLRDEDEVKARMLNKAFKGFGTDEELVSYAIGGSTKAQIEGVSDKYEELFGNSLAEVATSELDGLFEGDFQKAVSQYLTRDPVGCSNESVLLPEGKDVGQLRREVSAALDYIAMDDAKQIRKACKGFGTNDSELISILTTRSKAQLARTDNMYRRKYDISIREQIADETSGSYKDFLLAMVQDKAQVDALLFDKAMKGWGTSEELLCELCATRTATELREASKAYRRMFDRELVYVVKKETSGNFEKFLVRLLECTRDETNAVDEEAAAALATALFEATHDEEGEESSTDKDVFIRTLARENPWQLAAISEAYTTQYPDEEVNTLEALVEDKLSGDTERVAKMMLKDRITLFCEMLEGAVSGLWDDKGIIVRILGANSKETIDQIQTKYAELHEGQTLVEALYDELDGDFKESVLGFLYNSNALDVPPDTTSSSELLADPACEAAQLSLDLARLEDYVAHIDARNIRQCCKGFGTDDQGLIDTLTHRTKKQLAKLNAAYVYRYSTTLVSQIKDETIELPLFTNHYREFLCNIIADRGKIDAIALRGAIKGFGTDDDTLIEICTTRTNAELKAAKKAYLDMYERDLYLDIFDDTSGDYRSMLLSLIQCKRQENEYASFWQMIGSMITGEEMDLGTHGRDDGPAVDDLEAGRVAELLYRYGEGKEDDVESGFVKYLCRYSPEMLQSVSVQYEIKYEKTLETAMEEQVGGDFLECCKLLLTPRLDAWAQLLMKAFEGWGTDDSGVARILGSVDKTTVVALAYRFAELAGRPLAEALSDELSGSFLDACISWITAEASVGDETVDADVTAEMLEHEVLCRMKATQITSGLKVSLMSEFGRLVIGEEEMNAASGRAGPWERFMFHPMAPNLFALQRSDNKMYVSVDEDGVLTCDVEKPAETETFYLCIKDTRIALRSCHGKWWTAERNGDLSCTADSIDESELFKVMLRPTYADDFTGPLDTEFIQPTLMDVNRQLQEELDMSLNHIAQYDATNIRECCIGLGTNDEELIRILTSRTKSQLARVDKFYRLKYDMCIAEQIADECSGDYKTFLTSMCKSSAVVDAQLIHEAMEGLGTDDDALVELCCTRSNLEIKRMKKAYARLYGRPLIQVVRSETSGAYQKLLVRVLLGIRCESKTVSRKAAEKQAAVLYKAMSKSIADRDAIIDVLTRTAPPQLALVDEVYTSKYGVTLAMAIDNAINSTVSGGFKRVCKTMIKDPITVFCELLNKAFEGWGTDEDTIMRVIGGHDKSTVNAIRDRYAEIYHKPLIEDLESELSGDFKDAVIQWVISEGVGGEPLPDESTVSLKHDMVEYFEDVSSTRSRLVLANKEALAYIAYCDARAIRKACKGLGTNDSKLIDILTTRTKMQLQQIDDAYVYNYGSTIVSQIKDETSGNYKDFLCAMVTDKAKFDARLIHKSVAGWGTNEDLLTEIVCTRTNAELKRMKQAYYELYETEVLQDVMDDTSGDYGRLLTRILQADRDESGPEEVSEELAAEQAAQLVEAGVGKAGTDEDVFLDILCKASPAQCAAISAAHEEATGHSLKDAISDEMDMWGEGDLKTALKMLLFDRIHVFAHLLHKAFKGLGTDEAQCMRILGGADKPTLLAISLAFEEQEGRPLEEAIDSELSGDFRDCVIQWLTMDAVGLEDEANRDRLYDTEMLKDGDEGVKEAEKDPFDVIPERLAPSQLRRKNSQLRAVLEDTLDAIADYDVQCIKECCDGIGTNDAELINIITGRSKDQLERISKRYRVKYENTLSGQIGAECSRDYRRFLQACVKDKGKLDAEQWYEAMKGGSFGGLGTNESLLTELATSRTNDELLSAKAAYRQIYDTPLTSDIRSELGRFKRNYQELLLTLLQGQRGEDDTPNELLAMKQARYLHKKGEGKFFGTDEHAFIKTIALSSPAQLKSIDYFYNKFYGRSLERAIRSEMSGDLEDCLCCLLMDNAEQFARALRRAFKGLGTDDNAVCRIIGGCNYEQLKAVQEKYYELYGRPLVEDIDSECSGDYKQAVICKCINEPVGEEDQMPEPNLTPLEDAIADFWRLRKTLERAQEFLCIIDAKRIRKACAGWGTNDSELIAILSSRTKDSLQKISDIYCERYGCTLVGQIKDECSFNYATFLCSMVRDRSKVDAMNFKKAMKGLGTDDDVLVELTCTRSNKELWEVKSAYKMIYNTDLVQDVKSETSGVYRKFLVRVLRCRRDEGTEPDEELAAEQADELNEAVEDAKEIKERILPSGKDAYLDILTKVTPEQAALISQAYEDKYGCSLETVIEENMGFMYRSLKKCCRTIIKPRLAAFADLLLDAFKGLGTDDACVSRVLGGNDKSMVKQIAIEFQNRHEDGDSLIKALESELSGDFLKAAKAWVENSAVGMDDMPKVAPMRVEAIPWDIESANWRLQNQLDKTLDEIAIRDARALFEACDGMGTDEAAVTNIITQRTLPQMARIDKFYQKLYSRTVEAQLVDELSGDLETFMLTLLRTRIEADVYALRKAMKGLGTDELLLISVLTQYSPQELAGLKTRYQEVHDRDLVEDVESEVSGDYGAMLMRLLNGPWSAHKNGSADLVDLNTVEYHCTQLYNAGEAQWGTDEDTFVAIIGSSSHQEIAAIDACYRSKYNKSLAKVIKSEFSGDIRKVLMAVALPPVDRLCFLLHKAMAGAGTNEAVIIQVIGNADRRTIQKVICRYDQMYGKSLETVLDSEIGGDFGKAVFSYVLADTQGEDIPPENRMVPLDDDVMEYFRKRDVLRKAVYYIGALDATKLRKATKGIGTDESSLTRTICNQTRDGLKRLDEQMVFRYDITLIGLVRSECSGDFAKFLVAIIRDTSYTLAELFRTCVEGWGTDEKLLSELICTSTNQQLQDAQKAYALMFDRSLWRDVASDTSGSYRQLLLALLKGSRGEIEDGWDAEAAATQLFQSGEAKLGTDESTFIAVYALFSQEQLAEIAGAYEGISGTPLPDAIADEGFSDDFAELALSLQTPPSDLMCAQLVDRFAQDEGAIAGLFSALSDAMQADWRVIRTIGALPKNTVDALVAQYEEAAGASLRSAVEERLSGDYAAAVLQWISASPSVGMTDPAVAAMVDQGDEEAQPLAEEPTELFLKYDTDGTDSLSYPQILTLIEEEGYTIPQSLDWFDSDSSGDFSQTEFGRLYAVLVHKKAKLEERIANGLPADEQMYLQVLDFDPAFIEPQPVLPPKPPNAAMDAEKLTELLNSQVAYIAYYDAAVIKAACPESLEDDQDTFLSILCDRSLQQRAVLSDHWEQNNGKTLAVQIEDDRDDGQYKSFINRLIGRSIEEDCKALFKAMDGFGTTQRVLSEILVTRSNAELEAIQTCYSEMYDRTLRDHVADEAGGDYGKFLAKLISCERDEGADPDDGLADEQADRLIKAAKGWGVDEDTFVEILGGANAGQIELIKAAYEGKKGDPLAEMVESELGGDLEWACLLRLKSPIEAKAFLLHVAMDGMGTSEDIISRVMGGVGSKEETMAIQACYEETYGSLAEAFESEFGGSLLKAMQHCMAETSPAYYSNALEISEDDDKEAIIAAWPQYVAEGTPP